MWLNNILNNCKNPALDSGKKTFRCWVRMPRFFDHKPYSRYREHSDAANHELSYLHLHHGLDPAFRLSKYAHRYDNVRRYAVGWLYVQLGTLWFAALPLVKYRIIKSSEHLLRAKGQSPPIGALGIKPPLTFKYM